MRTFSPPSPAQAVSWGFPLKGGGGRRKDAWLTAGVEKTEREEGHLRSPDPGSFLLTTLEALWAARKRNCMQLRRQKKEKSSGSLRNCFSCFCTRYRHKSKKGTFPKMCPTMTMTTTEGRRTGTILGLFAPLKIFLFPFSSPRSNYP